MDTYLERARREIESATGHLTAEQIGREVPGRWSVALILEHLTLTFRLNVSALDKALESGETKARKPTLAQRVSRTVVIGFGYFPKATAPDAVAPSGSIPPEQARAEILGALEGVYAKLDVAAERFGTRTPILKHAFFAALTVPQWRRFHWRHVQHHMRQVRARSAA
jgi:hypothetical protein